VPVGGLFWRDDRIDFGFLPGRMTLAGLVRYKSIPEPPISASALSSSKS
jgi:hypothetical protein